MPLESGSSKAAFSKNVATEMNAGKPQKQAVAIAYSKRGDAEETKGEQASEDARMSAIEGRLSEVEGKKPSRSDALSAAVDAVTELARDGRRLVERADSLGRKRK